MGDRFRLIYLKSTDLEKSKGDDLPSFYASGGIPREPSPSTEFSWPGNVRELENVIERAVILCDAELIGPEDLAVPSSDAAPSPAPAAPAGGPAASLEEIERDHILRVLREAGGNQSRASQLLGIDRKTLYLKLRKYGLPEASG